MSRRVMCRLLTTMAIFFLGCAEELEQPILTDYGNALVESSWNEAGEIEATLSYPGDDQPAAFLRFDPASNRVTVGAWGQPETPWPLSIPARLQAASDALYNFWFYEVPEEPDDGQEDALACYYSTCIGGCLWMFNGDCGSSNLFCCSPACGWVEGECNR